MSSLLSDDEQFFNEFRCSSPDDLSLLTTDDTRSLPSTSSSGIQNTAASSSTEHTPQPIINACEQPAWYYVECSRGEPYFERSKTRLCCFKFDQPSVDSHDKARDFLAKLVHDIERVRKSGYGSYGLPIKTATFFILPDSTVWYVLVSHDSLYLTKWNKVFEGINASAGRMYRNAGRRLQSSFYGVLKMFPTVTANELGSNLMDFEVEQRVVHKRRKVPVLRQLDMSSPTNHPPPPIPDQETTSSTPQSDQTTAAVVRLPAIMHSFDILVTMCTHFLNSPQLDTVSMHSTAIRRFLDASATRNALGLYLLDGHVAATFTRIVVLKTFVLECLERHYGIEHAALTLQSVLPHEPNMPPEAFVLLRSLVGFNEAMSSLLTFAMFDPVSVLVYLSFYILQIRQDPEQREGYDSPTSRYFLYRHSYIISEYPWVFARYLRLLHDFLVHEISVGHASHCDLQRWMLAGDPTHEDLVGQLCVGFPPNAMIMAAPTVNRFTYRVRQHRQMVDELCRVHGIDSARSLPIRIWRRAQDHRSVFYQMRVDHPIFLLLPANASSPHPDSHSKSVRDVARFYGFEELPQQQ